MTESTNASVFKIAAFWTAYTLGTLALLFSFLFAQVPRPRHGGNFTLDYIFWSLSGSFLLATQLAARYAWKTWNPLTPRGVSNSAQLFVGAAWVELALLLHGIIGFATSR